MIASLRYKAEQKLTPTTVSAATFGRLANVALDAQVRRPLPFWPKKHSREGADTLCRFATNRSRV